MIQDLKTRLICSNFLDYIYPDPEVKGTFYYGIWEREHLEKIVDKSLRRSR